MEKTCGNCGYYKDIPQMHSAGCTIYEPIPLMAEDGPFLGYPPIDKEQNACDDWMPESGQYTRVVVSPTPKKVTVLPDGKVPPEWLRTTFVDEKSDRPDTDRVFVPLEVFGNLHEQFLCACYDGVPIIRDEGHLYVPASWIIQQQPELEKSITMAVNQVLTATCKSSA